MTSVTHTDSDKETKVLLIEDNPGDARLIKEYLKDSQGVSLHWTDSYQKGLQALELHVDSVVLLDLNLPDGEGLDMITVIRARFPSVSIVVLTGLPDDAKALEALQCGAQDYLVKGSTDAEELKRSIRYAVERKKIINELRFQKTLLECESEASPDGIVIALENGSLTSWNNQFLSMWKITKEEMLKFNAPSLLDRIGKLMTSEELFLTQSELLIQSQGDKKRDIYQLQDGRFIESYSAPVVDGTGRYFGRAWYFSDVTDRKKMERIKDDFINTVSHELRTPLAIIKGAVSNLRDGIIGALSEKQAHIIDITYKNTERLARLINDLLDLSRLESGKTQPKRKRTEVFSLIDDCLVNFLDEATERNLVIEKVISAELPPIYADADMFVQVLTNVLSNALRFARSKVRIVAKTSSALIDGSDQVMVEFRVEDDGQGISKENMSRLFNKFEQLQRPSGGAGYKGTGLGLAICREIIDLHQGKIWAESEEGKGSSFCFMMPKYDDENDFRNTLSAAIEKARVQNKQLMLLSLSINNHRDIKKVTGDAEFVQILNTIEEQVRLQALRKTDDIYHYTLKDFLIILPEVNSSIATSVADRIKKVIENCINKETSEQIQANISIALAGFPEDATSVENLMSLVFKKD